MSLLPETDARRAKNAPFVVAWLIMLALAAISFGVAFFNVGLWAPIVQFGIAATQAATLFILFMRLKGPPSLKWVFAVSGFLWLLFLFGLSMTDYAARRGWPPLYDPSGPSLRPNSSQGLFKTLPG